MRPAPSASCGPYRSFESGADLGPRGPHVRALCSSPERLLDELREECDLFLAPLDANAREVRQTRSALDQLVRSSETLIASARSSLG